MATQDPSGGASGVPPEAPASPGAVGASVAGQRDPAQQSAVSSGTAPRPPVAEINLVDQPDLDRSPEAFGQKVAEGQKTVDAEYGVSSYSETPYATVDDSYNSDQSRDVTRQTITLWLIGLLCAIVALTFVALFARGASTGFTDKEFFHELKQVLDVLVGPVITLLASAVGFYFGYKQGELGDQARNNHNSRPPTT